MTDQDPENFALRNDLDPAQRAYPAEHSIDAGFVNHRILLQLLPQQCIHLMNDEISRIPDSVLPHERQNFIRFLQTQTAIILCQQNKVRTLGEVLLSSNLAPGHLFSSTETVIGSEEVYGADRVKLRVRLGFPFLRSVFLEFSTSNIAADTTRMELSETHTHSIIGQVRRVTSQEIVTSPIILGGPILRPSTKQPPPFQMQWWTAGQFYEHFVEDLDPFREVARLSRLDVAHLWKDALPSVSEETIKKAICKLLGDEPAKDWGGEQCDIFTAGLSVAGSRTTAAFLLKGPGKGFSPMSFKRHLGASGDQIYRLANTPAELLVLQHIHEVPAPVRATLRAFAVNPASPRRFCVIDGPDTYRLLKCYNFL